MRRARARAHAHAPTAATTTCLPLHARSAPVALPAPRLHDLLMSKNSNDSLLRISVVLAASDGTEIDGMPELAEFRYSLKEMIQARGTSRNF